MLISRKVLLVSEVLLDLNPTVLLQINMALCNCLH